MAQILEERGRAPFPPSHCSPVAAILRSAIALGLFISFTGILTFEVG
jgi:hypothetical protein